MKKHPNDDFIGTTIKEFLIPADKVAHVQIGNNIEHALLVLTKTGYAAVPVLDPTYKLHGLIRTSLILDAILGLERIEFERLEKIKVEQVMQCDIPRLNLTDPLSQGINLVINHPFVCVENNEGIFEGIFTRRELLKKFNRQIKRFLS